MFDAYRSGYRDSGVPGGGGLSFMPLVFTADNEAEAEAGATELTWYLKAKVAPQHRNPPGYVSVDLNVKVLQGAYAGRTAAMRAATLEFQKEQGVIVYGTPDSVAAQIKRFYDRVGGFDHLLMMQQAGFLDHQRTVREHDVVRQGGDAAGRGPSRHRRLRSGGGMSAGATHIGVMAGFVPAIHDLHV